MRPQRKDPNAPVVPQAVTEMVDMTRFAMLAYAGFLADQRSIYGSEGVYAARVVPPLVITDNGIALDLEQLNTVQPQPDKPFWARIISENDGAYSFRECIRTEAGEWVNIVGKGSNDEIAREANDATGCTGVVLMVPVRIKDTAKYEYVFSVSSALLFCKLVDAYDHEGGSTAAAKLCDAAGTLLSPAVAITLHAGWTLANGCQIETDQIIPIIPVGDDYHAIGKPKDVVVDIRLVDSASTNTLKVQKKLRTDFGAFHTSVSDWIDATGATTTGPFECPEDA